MTMNEETVKKKHRRRTILFAAVLTLLMTGIFLFSAQPGDSSGRTSGPIALLVARLTVPGLEDLPPEAREDRLEQVHFVIRKLAHFSEFLLLGLVSRLFCSVAWSERKLPGTLLSSAALLFGALYAVTDEIHQLFVPGRSCELRDWLIDVCGVTVGVGIAWLAASLRRRSARKKSR